MLKFNKTCAGDYTWCDNNDYPTCKKSIHILRKGSKWYLYYSDFVTDFFKMYVLDSLKEAFEYANMIVQY